MEKYHLSNEDIALACQSAESFNPRNPDNDSDAELLRRLTSNFTSSYTWQHKSGCNVIHLSPQKKPRISLTAMTIIAIVLAVIAGMLCLNLPEGIRVPLLNDFVSPILDTVLGVIAAVAGPTVFFSLVWGVGAIGDMETLSKIGKRMLLSFLVGLLLLSLIATLVCSPFFTIEVEGDTAFQFSQILSLLLNVIPTNLFSPFTEGNIQQMIVLAVVFGIVLLVLGEELSAVSNLINQLNTMIQYIMGLVIALVPPMVFLSIFKIVVNGQASLILKAYKLIPLCLGIALLFIALYTLIIAVKHKVSVVTLVKYAGRGRAEARRHHRHENRRTLWRRRRRKTGKCGSNYCVTDIAKPPTWPAAWELS